MTTMKGLPLAQAYTDLGVNDTDSDDAIRNAYRILALKFHPDKNNGSAEATKNFQRISAAFKRIQAHRTGGTFTTTTTTTTTTAAAAYLDENGHFHFEHAAHAPASGANGSGDDDMDFTAFFMQLFDMTVRKDSKLRDNIASQSHNSSSNNYHSNSNAILSPPPPFHGPAPPPDHPAYSPYAAAVAAAAAAHHHLQAHQQQLKQVAAAANHHSSPQKKESPVSSSSIHKCDSCGRPNQHSSSVEYTNSNGVTVRSAQVLTTEGALAKAGLAPFTTKQGGPDVPIGFGMRVEVIGNENRSIPRTYQNRDHGNGEIDLDEEGYDDEEEGFKTGGEDEGEDVVYETNQRKLSPEQKAKLREKMLKKRPKNKRVLEKGQREMKEKEAAKKEAEEKKRKEAELEKARKEEETKKKQAQDAADQKCRSFLFECTSKSQIETVKGMFNASPTSTLDFVPFNVRPLSINLSVLNLELWEYTQRQEGLLEISLEKGIQETLLHVAVRCRCLDLAEFFISRGAPVWAADKDGRTPLHVTAEDVKGVPFARMLLKAGPRGYVDSIAFGTQRTALHYAACKGNFEMVEVLVMEYHARLNVIDSQGFTPEGLAKMEMGQWEKNLQSATSKQKKDISPKLKAFRITIAVFTKATAAAKEQQLKKDAVANEAKRKEEERLRIEKEKDAAARRKLKEKLEKERQRHEEEEKELERLRKGVYGDNVEGGGENKKKKKKKKREKSAIVISEIDKELTVDLSNSSGLQLTPQTSQHVLPLTAQAVTQQYLPVNPDLSFVSKSISISPIQEVQAPPSTASMIPTSSSPIPIQRGSQLQTLVNMGFTEIKARKALVSTGGRVEDAIETLFNGNIDQETEEAKNDEIAKPEVTEIQVNGRMHPEDESTCKDTKDTDTNGIFASKEIASSISELATLSHNDEISEAGSMSKEPLVPIINSIMASPIFPSSPRVSPTATLVDVPTAIPVSTVLAPTEQFSSPRFSQVQHPVQQCLTPVIIPVPVSQPHMVAQYPSPIVNQSSLPLVPPQLLPANLYSSSFPQYIQTWTNSPVQIQSQQGQIIQVQPIQIQSQPTLLHTPLTSSIWGASPQPQWGYGPTENGSFNGGISEHGLNDTNVFLPPLSDRMDGLSLDSVVKNSPNRSPRPIGPPPGLHGMQKTVSPTPLLPQVPSSDYIIGSPWGASPFRTSPTSQHATMMPSLAPPAVRTRENLLVSTINGGNALNMAGIEPSVGLGGEPTLPSPTSSTLRAIAPPSPKVSRVGVIGSAPVRRSSTDTWGTSNSSGNGGWDLFGGADFGTFGKPVASSTQAQVQTDTTFFSGYNSVPSTLPFTAQADSAGSSSLFSPWSSSFSPFDSTPSHPAMTHPNEIEGKGYEQSMFSSLIGNNPVWGAPLGVFDRRKDEK